MANIQILPYAQQMAAIQRQRKLADLLQEQGMQPSTTQMVSGIAIPTSPWETASKLAQSLAGAYAQSRSDKEEAAAKKQAREEYKQNIQDFISAIGPQKQVTQVPLAKDITQAAGPEDYQDIMNQPYQTRDMAQAATPEDVQDIVNQPYVTKDVTSYTPGLSRNQAIARLLEMQGSENPYIAAAAPTLTGLLPKQVDATDLFNKLDMSKLTPESVQEVLASGDIGKAKFIEAADDKANWQIKTRTTYDSQGNEINQDYMFNPANKSIELLGQSYKGKPNIPAGISPMTLAQYSMEAEAFKNQWGYYPPGYPAGGAGAETGVTPSKPETTGRPLSAAQYRDFKSKESDINEAAGNFTNFRSVLKSISPTQGLVGKQSGELATAFKTAQASIRLLQNTGVLNQGELPFLEETLADPQGFMSLATPLAREKLEGQLNELDKLVKRKLSTLYNQYEQPLPASSQTTNSNQNTATGSFAGVPAGFESYYESTP